MNINRKIKELRLDRGYTLEELAKAAGLTKGYLSRMERARKAPPFSTLESIAVALNQDLAYFLKKTETENTSKNIDLMRQAEHAPMITSIAGYSYRQLAKDYQRKYMTPFIMHIGKGATKYFKHDGEEFVYVLAGSVALEYEGRTFKLGEGDGFYLDSRIKHRFKNNGKVEARLLAVNFTYRRF